MDCVVYIPDLLSQRKIGKLISGIDKKIDVNEKVNHNLYYKFQSDMVA